MKGLKLLGHPLHPAIVHFPVAAWTATVLTDALYLGLRDPIWWQASFWLLVAGCLTGLGAMAAGFVELLALPAESAVQQRALRHMYFMSSAWTLYLVDLLIRFVGSPEGGALPWIDLALSVVGFLTLLAGAYLGAQLVYDFGVGQTGRGIPPQGPSANRPSVTGR